MNFQIQKEYDELIEILSNQITVIDEEKVIALNRLKAMAEEDNDLYLYAAYYHYMAMKLIAEDKMDESIDLSKRALSYAELSNNTFIAIKANNSLGIDYSEKAEYVDSLQYYLRAYYLATKYQEYDMDWVVLNNIGNLFVWVEDYESGASFIESAYNKYMSKENKDLETVMLLLINVIELHSFAKHYDKVDYWTSLDTSFFAGEFKIVLNAIILMNTITKNQDVFSEDELAEKIDKFVELGESAEDFIYIFRMAIKVLEIAIEKSSQSSIQQLIDMMKRKREHSNISTFDLAFDSALCLYEFKYSTNQANEIFVDYFKKSKTAIGMLRKIHSKSLFVQIELEEEKETHRDTAEEKMLLQKKLEVDSFTGIYNKIYVESKISEELLKSTEQGVQGIFVIDIDHFKRVNDELGHDVGDKILLKVADILKEYKQDNYIVGRYGGDEFILFLKSAKSIEELENIANDLLLRATEIETSIEDMSHITFSIGIAINACDMKFDSLFKRADEALYQSKNNGRNQYTIV